MYIKSPFTLTLHMSTLLTENMPELPVPHSRNTVARQWLRFLILGSEGPGGSDSFSIYQGDEAQHWNVKPSYKQDLRQYFLVSYMSC